MIRIDLHTHSSASPDGGIKPHQYIKILQEEKLNCIAVTDHNTIEMAQRLHEQLGERIIVGEEIMTSEGEIIGLFLSRAIPAGLSAKETVDQIKEQGGLVYIPHPFETVRSGISHAALGKIAPLVDIVEVQNGRAVFQNKGPEAITWAKMHKKAVASASDAHGAKGLGYSYTKITEIPQANTLVELLNVQPRFITKRPPLHTLLYPKLNRIKKLVRKK